MAKKILIVLGVILLGVAIWLYIGVSRVISAEKDVMTRFHDIVQYYASMDQDYVTPLLSASGGLIGNDLGKLQSIDGQMRDLATTVNPDDQFDKLIALQKAIIPFVGNSGFSENLLSDSRFQQWNKNSTNLGQASILINKYNEALSFYNARLKSSAGHLAGLWKRWSHHLYLGIDGSLQEQTRIDF